MNFLGHYEVSPSLRSHGLHAHDYFEFYLHIKGGRQYCVDDSVFELNPYQIIIIPPLHMHGLVCDRDLVDYERCYLYLTPETLRACGFNTIDLCALFEEACNNKTYTQQLTEENGTKIISCIKSIEQMGNVHSDNATDILEVFSLILNIIKIAQKAGSTKSKPVNQNYQSNSMYKILHYINQHFTENISIKDLCSIFNMSESAMSHEFKKYSNKSVYEYILYKRIIKAKELLVTDSNLTQIAMECGFNDYSNFLRIFKKISGCSPKEYKNKLATNKQIFK